VACRRDLRRRVDGLRHGHGRVLVERGRHLRRRRGVAGGPTCPARLDHRRRARVHRIRRARSVCGRQLLPPSHRQPGHEQLFRLLSDPNAAWVAGGRVEPLRSGGDRSVRRRGPRRRVARCGVLGAAFDRRRRGPARRVVVRRRVLRLRRRLGARGERVELERVARGVAARLGGRRARAVVGAQGGLYARGLQPGRGVGRRGGVRVPHFPHAPHRRHPARAVRQLLPRRRLRGAQQHQALARERGGAQRAGPGRRQGPRGRVRRRAAGHARVRGRGSRLRRRGRSAVAGIWFCNAMFSLIYFSV
jgi:hypothetical protein